MRRTRNYCGLTLTITATMLLSIQAFAQQISGTPGSPSATETIDGKQLPPPPGKFGGVIKESAKDSKPYWQPRVVPPKGAPNVLLIMTDDQGYGVSGYDSVIGPESATVGEILKENGYATSWFGKNHNTPTYQYSVSGPFDQWPSGMGFEYFYGFMGGETDQWTPYLYRDHTQIFPFVGKPGYNLTTDLADEAIKHMRDLNAAAPDKPFFVYYAPGGTHSPHQPTPEWIAKFKGKFDMGYEKLREQIFDNQKKLGVIPPDTKLTPWPDGQAEFGGAKLPRWDSLSLIQKKLYAHEAEVFAAYVAYTDDEIGRVIQEVQDMGKLDNTLIIY